jgi:hypothetical protein
MAALAAGLSACSGGDGVSGATATVTATVTVTPSAEVSETPEPSSSPFPSPEPSAAPSKAPPKALPSMSGAGSRDTDATLRGQIALRGADAITVTTGSDQGVKALLLDYTVVLDGRGLICGDGPAPRNCSADQLRKALGKGDVFLAKVTIKDGVAVQIEEITKE